MTDRPFAPSPSRRQILAASLILPFTAARAARKPAPAALLAPLSGPRAALGRSMARAATLAQGRDAHGLIVLDAGGNAAAAAMQAIKQGAGLILGPLASEDVAPVLAAVGGRVPVVAFSNDRDLRERGGFVLGITADQIVSSLLRYARGRGIRRIALAAKADRWGSQVDAAARALAARLDVAIVPTAEADAVLASAAEPLPATGGSQLLLAAASTEADPTTLPMLQGAWTAGPDPTAFAPFAAGFEAANGAPPGLIAGLAYDAVAMAMTLQRGGGSDRSALLAPGGFKGVCGDFVFRDDGSAGRALAILALESDRYRVIRAPEKTTSG